MQLAALALPTHPYLFRLVPRPPAVKQKKALRPRVGLMKEIEAGNPFARDSNNFVIAIDALRCSIGPVGQQRKAEIVVRIGEVVDFQALDLLFDGRFAREEKRYRDQRSERCRHAVAQGQRGQDTRAEDARDATVCERDCHIDRWK